jgi:lipoprotein signal peptidase
VHTGRLYQLFTVVISAVIAFSLDRAAKLWALSHLIFGEESAFWPGILQFRLTNNTGAAFSLGRDHAPDDHYSYSVYNCLHWLGP